MTKKSFIIATITLLANVTFSQTIHSVGTSYSTHGVVGFHYFKIKNQGIGYWGEIRKSIPDFRPDIGRTYTPHVASNPAAPRLRSVEYNFDSYNVGLTRKLSKRVSAFIGGGVTKINETWIFTDDWLFGEIEEKQKPYYLRNITGGVLINKNDSGAVLSLGFNSVPRDFSMGFSIPVFK